MCVSDNFLPNHTVLGGRRAVRQPLFQNVPECALNHLHYFSVLQDVHKNKITFFLRKYASMGIKGLKFQH